MTLRLIVSDLTIVPGTSIIISTQSIELHNRTICNLCFNLTNLQREKFEKITGTETVTINVVGIGSCTCFDSFGNVFYSEKLRNCFNYCLKFGNNGKKDAVNHFIVANEPCCNTRYNPNGIGSAVPSIPEVKPPTQPDPH